MARQLREDIANLIDEPDWDNSDASLNKDDDYSLLGLTDPLQRAEDNEDSNEESGRTQQRVHSDAGSFLPQESEQPCASDAASFTGPSPTFSVMFNDPVGPAIDMDSTATAINFFDITFGNDIMDLLVEQINLYATQYPPSGTIHVCRKYTCSSA